MERWASLFTMTTVSQVPTKKSAVARIAYVGRSDPVCALTTATIAPRATMGAIHRCVSKLSFKVYRSRADHRINFCPSRRWEIPIARTSRRSEPF